MLFIPASFQPTFLRNNNYFLFQTIKFIYNPFDKLAVQYLGDIFIHIESITLIYRLVFERTCIIFGSFLIQINKVVVNVKCLLCI